MRGWWRNWGGGGGNKLKFGSAGDGGGGQNTFRPLLGVT